MSASGQYFHVDAVWRIASAQAKRFSVLLDAPGALPWA
jgi:hypothetical protein